MAAFSSITAPIVNAIRRLLASDNVWTGTNTFSGGTSYSGDLTPSANNTYDVGTSSLRWRAGYFGTATFTGRVQLANGSANALYALNTLAVAKHVIGINASDQVLISGDGALVSFGGAIAINNTVSAAVAVPSTHKVTMSIGGVTYYLLASNV